MSRWVAALRLTGVGFFIGGSIVLGTVGGFWLDTRLGTKPIFILGGLLLGLVIAGLGVYQMLLPLFNKKQDKEGS